MPHQVEAPSLSRLILPSLIESIVPQCTAFAVPCPTAASTAAEAGLLPDAVNYIKCAPISRTPLRSMTHTSTVGARGSCCSVQRSAFICLHAKEWSCSAPVITCACCSICNALCMNITCVCFYFTLYVVSWTHESFRACVFRHIYLFSQAWPRRHSSPQGQQYFRQ